MLNERATFYEALKLALKKGPVIINVNGKACACYALSRKEVEDMFEEHFFVLRRNTWREHMNRWQSYGAIVPREALKKEVTSDWKIIFTALSKDEHLALRMCADKNDVYYIPEFSGSAMA